MKNLLNIISQKAAILILVGLATTCFMTGCEDNDLPGANSKPDTIPPEADFSYASDAEDFRIIHFTNLSTEALSFEWSFGEGETSTEIDPTFTFNGEGEFEVSLTATDGLGVTNTMTQTVLVEEGPYQPIILEPGFEGDGETGDARDPWDAEWSTVIQISSSPVASGSQAGKLPSDGARVAYQEILVEAETNYDIGFLYTLTNAVPGSITVDILDVDANGGTFMSYDETQDHVIGSVTVNDQEDPNVYVEGEVSFASGTSTLIAIMVSNTAGIDARFDDFKIEIGRVGEVPPSAAFSVVQRESNYLEYSFTNNSKNASTYLWDFGDGNTSTEESPTHVYAEADEYTVTLTASSDGGLTADFKTNINIQAPVTAAFTYQVDPDDYRTYSFTDASEDAVMLLWEFGDGFQFTGMNPTHTFDEDGIYTVKLTAYSLTGAMDVEEAQLTVAQGFIVEVLNGTFDEYTFNTGDNADAWDMTPNSTLVDNDGNEIPSPYDPLWDNGDLDSWLEGFYGDDSEQPSSSSDGNNDTRGLKLNEVGRRIYQVVQVQQGVDYTFSVDSRAEVDGHESEIFILNTEIADETGINASTSDAAIDEYYLINNDFNSDKTVFTTTTFTFTPSTDQIVIYIRSLDAVDNDNEVWFDNVEITNN